MRDTIRFIVHVMCFGAAAAVLFGMLGVPALSWLQWTLVNFAISAAWWPVFDLKRLKRRAEYFEFCRGCTIGTRIGKGAIRWPDDSD